MYAETPWFELSETVFGILVLSRSIKVVVEPTLRKYRALLPENTNLLYIPELSPTRCNSYKSRLMQQVPLYLIYYTTIYQIESYSYKVLDTATANLLEYYSKVY